ncbi:MAG: hypothetical protein OIF38_04855 [Cellvibrionaceae bacterium]|nr:hypothetical protein [Cellvibrionaceae bacterium]
MNDMSNPDQNTAQGAVAEVTEVAGPDNPDELAEPDDPIACKDQIQLGADAADGQTVSDTVSKDVFIESEPITIDIQTISDDSGRPGDFSTGDRSLSVSGRLSRVLQEHEHLEVSIDRGEISERHSDLADPWQGWQGWFDAVHIDLKQRFEGQDEAFNPPSESLGLFDVHCGNSVSDTFILSRSEVEPLPWDEARFEIAQELDMLTELGEKLEKLLGSIVDPERMGLETIDHQCARDPAALENQLPNPGQDALFDIDIQSLPMEVDLLSYFNA